MEQNIRPARYKITVPITIELNGTSDEERDEILERAKRLLEYKIQEGEYDYDPEDIEIMDKKVQYTSAELKAMDEAWNKFLRSINSNDR